MEFDLHSNVKAINALDVAAARVDGTDAGNIIDTLGYESLEYVVQTGTITDGTHTVLLEDGDDSGLSDAAAVPAANRLGDLPVIVAADDDTVFRVGSMSKKRYQRLSIVTTGATTGGVSSAVALLGNPTTRPEPDQST